MAVLIDSSVLISYERGKIDLLSKIKDRETDDFFLSIVSASELLHGVHRANTEAIRMRRTVFVEAILASIPILPVDLPIAREHARLWADLASRGMMIGVHDSWLAATCLRYGLTMVTDNVREFERVAGLKFESWSV